MLYCSECRTSEKLEEIGAVKYFGQRSNKISSSSDREANSFDKKKKKNSNSYNITLSGDVNNYSTEYYPRQINKYFIRIHNTIL